MPIPHLFLLVIFGLLLLSSPKGQAQDIHFSQFYHSPINLNPALTGVFNGNYRMTGNFRNQWFSVPVSYMTFSGSFDTRLFPSKLKNDALGGGIQFNYDEAGDSKLSTLNLNLSSSFIKRISKTFFMGIGVQAGYSQRRFQTSDLTFDDQFTGDLFDSRITSTDLGNLEMTSIAFFDLAVGMIFRYQKNRRVYFDYGVSLFHLNHPNQSFMGVNARLDRKISGFFNSSFKIYPKWDLIPSALFSVQGDYVEVVGGLSARYHLNENEGREVAIYFGSAYRIKDAIIARLGFNYQNMWTVEMSYDINVSKFARATNGHGGFEIGAIYIWSRVPDLGPIKTCPIF